jgi:hypothetical protein
MKPHHQKVLKEVLGLPLEARAALAGHLLNSLDDSVDEDANRLGEKRLRAALKILIGDG